MGLGTLGDVWRKLDIRQHIRPTILGVLEAMIRTGRRSKLGAHALDPSALEELVIKHVDWSALHRNVDAGTVRALLVAALDIGSGRTTLFGELAPGEVFRPTTAATRTFRGERISADHVLASAAIPLVFPAREVGGRYYCDGGLRFNTPMSPAIRAGADRLVIISLRADTSGLRSGESAEIPVDAYRNPFFLAGKLLDALFLDPLAYDLQILERFNKLLDLLGSSLGDDARARFEALQDEVRGARYQKIQTLVFSPSRDIGCLAGSFLSRKHGEIGERLRYGLLSKGIAGSIGEADLPSYVLFDGGFASELIELGERDALESRDRIRSFFFPDEFPLSAPSSV
jgi:NTE family protein